MLISMYLRTSKGKGGGNGGGKPDKSTVSHGNEAS